MEDKSSSSAVLWTLLKTSSWRRIDKVRLTSSRVLDWYSYRSIRLSTVLYFCSSTLNPRTPIPTVCRVKRVDFTVPSFLCSIRLRRKWICGFFRESVFVSFTSAFGMIHGIGTDLVQLSRIASTFQRFGDRFVHRILSAEEITEFQQYTRPKEQYLSSR